MLISRFKLSKDHLIKFGFILFSIVISGTIFYFRNELEKLAGLGYLGIFLINLLGSATIVIPTPAIVATFIGGSIYNPYLVGLVSGVGTTIGELTGYIAGLGATALIEEDKKYQKIRRWMSINGFITIFILALIPNPFFDLSGIVSGATKYPLKKFLLATFLGKTLRFIMIALVGANSLHN